MNFLKQGGNQWKHGLLVQDQTTAIHQNWCAAPARTSPKHRCAGGTAPIEYKYRYCCSVDIFFCFGTTHFCNACHEDFQPKAKQLERIVHCTSSIHQLVKSLHLDVVSVGIFTRSDLFLAECTVCQICQLFLFCP